ncbi:MAG: PspC domain-containing protein [Clostridia bacterium]|nr:PspC domain-containing protein [Clostridia bacterium]
MRGVCGGIGEWLRVDPTIIWTSWAVLACDRETDIALYFHMAFAAESSFCHRK